MRTSEEKASIRDRFLAVGTSNVADVLDQRGLLDQSLAPHFQSCSGEHIAGWAYTITGQMVPHEHTGDTQKMQACEGIGSNEVSVWSGNGSGVCYFGELIAVGMMERGSVGAVVDGGVRDTRWLRKHEFSVYARYRTPVQSTGRWRVTAWQVPVYLSGATSEWVIVKPGDFILADEDGLIVVPDDHVDEALARAERLTDVESKVREALRRGASLGECLERFGHV